MKLTEILISNEINAKEKVECLHAYEVKYHECFNYNRFCGYGRITDHNRKQCDTEGRIAAKILYNMFKNKSLL